MFLKKLPRTIAMETHSHFDFHAVYFLNCLRQLSFKPLSIKNKQQTNKQTNQKQPNLPSWTAGYLLFLQFSGRRKQRPMQKHEQCRSVFKQKTTL